MEVSAAACRSVSHQSVAIEKLKVVAQLAATDRKVRAHEPVIWRRPEPTPPRVRCTQFGLDRTAAVTT